MRWLERWLGEGQPTLRHFVDLASELPPRLDTRPLFPSRRRAGHLDLPSWRRRHWDPAVAPRGWSTGARTRCATRTRPRRSRGRLCSSWPALWERASRRSTRRTVTCYATRLTGRAARSTSSSRATTSRSRRAVERNHTAIDATAPPTIVGVVRRLGGPVGAKRSRTLSRS